MEILNEFKITPGICTSGQPTEEQLKQIAARGYQCVINLAMPNHEQSIDREGSIVTSLGMTYVHLPVPFDAPAKAHLDEFSELMDAFSDRKVWVHCIVNARVSAFLFCYLQTHRGMGPGEAATPLLKAWLPDMNKAWKSILGHAPAQL
ncbi:Predicted phosphohydrolase, protein tyrosine phosphatase (PTP) superfamily, DUF442 family [Marinobacter daqiaonensis]|uniref:Predicted phosphohydrolase, protein tyrosine phosphatase (PTP) superfamily, DUF442 family n=1 Tax=Marinobacter daqiaonensis TaxID=650891 RepID=A0A1I6I5D4_9GAMM|nr:protein tyrosine phosphatase family protein [Marinobacter daqiaonensis]SFR61911.1 Predicted phosphohydrolase, protein tyrosine phosphatase (PTP) superfamily, DUF442 family [Marinobacter daqiaonensis]